MKKKTWYQTFLTSRLNLKTYQRVGVVCLVVVIAGFVGWVYEFLFYALDAAVKSGSFQGFFMQGGNFLPWINIYAIGAVAVIAATYKLRRYPWAVFLIAIVVTGLVEFIGGWLVYQIGDGTRYWDYNTEILNFGNIGGFVCLRSVLVFGVSSMVLMYGILPLCIYLSQKMSRKAFLILAISLFAIVMADEVGNLIAKNTGHATAMDVYRSAGLRYSEDLQFSAE